MKRLVASTALLLCSHGARAQGAPVTGGLVSVEVHGCEHPAFERPAFQAALDNELRDLGVAIASAAADGRGTLVAELHLHEVMCDTGGDVVTVQLVDRLSHKTVARGVTLSGLDARARPRALALSSVELLRASWLELAQIRRRLAIQSVVHLGREVHVSLGEGAPKPTSAVETAPPRAEHAWAFAVHGVAAQWASYRASLAGPRLSAAHSAGAIRVYVASDFLFGESADLLGTVKLSLGRLQGGMELRAHVAESISLGVGPRLELGQVYFSGQPTSEARASNGAAWVAGVGLGTTARARLTSRMGLIGGADFGTMLAGARALSADRPSVGLSGHYLALHAGADWAF